MASRMPCQTGTIFGHAGRRLSAEDEMIMDSRALINPGAAGSSIHNLVEMGSGCEGLTNAAEAGQDSLDDAEVRVSALNQDSIPFQAS